MPVLQSLASQKRQACLAAVSGVQEGVEPVVTEEEGNIDKLKVSDLKFQLTALQLPITGLKAVLVTRLKEAVAKAKQAKGKVDAETEEEDNSGGGHGVQEEVQAEEQGQEVGEGEDVEETEKGTSEGQNDVQDDGQGEMHGEEDGQGEEVEEDANELEEGQEEGKGNGEHEEEGEIMEETEEGTSEGENDVQDDGQGEMQGEEDGQGEEVKEDANELEEGQEEGKGNGEHVEEGGVQSDVDLKNGKAAKQKEVVVQLAVEVCPAAKTAAARALHEQKAMESYVQETQDAVDAYSLEVVEQQKELQAKEQEASELALRQEGLDRKIETFTKDRDEIEQKCAHLQKQLRDLRGPGKTMASMK